MGCKMGGTMNVKKKKTGNNRGFSMVELLIAFGIMGVIVTTVGYMMTTSSKTYSSLSTEAQLQSEAQLVANAISELAIDSFDAGNVAMMDYTTKYDPTITDKSYFNLLSKTKTEKTRYKIYLNTTSKELYLDTETYDDATKAYTSKNSGALLGQYLEDFQVDLSRVKDENIISFTLIYKKNGRNYKGDYQVLMRNRAYADPDAKNDDTAEAQLKALTLTPKLVYIDVIKGITTQYYENSINSGAHTITNGEGSIKFEADPIYKGTPASKDSDWSLINYDSTIFSMSTAKGKESNLTWSNVGLDKFINTPNTEFSVVAAQGNIKKEARIRLRMVKKITWAGTAGISGWKSEYEKEPFNGRPAPDTSNYAEPGSSVTLIPSIVQANVSTGLTWKLYHRNLSVSMAEWQVCSNTALAKLSTTSTTGGRQSNTVIIGKNAMNKVDEFKVEVVSDFDDSVKAEYIFGILPTKRQDDDGDNSRGFRLNFNDWVTDPDRAGYTDRQTGPGNNGMFKVKSVKQVTNVEALGSQTVQNAKDLFYHPIDKDPLKDAGRGYIYVDMNSFGYQNNQEIYFYKDGQLSLLISFDYYYDEYKDENGKKVLVKENAERSGFIEYHVYPVKMDPLVPTTLCIKKGQSTAVDTKMKFYNVTNRSEWGIYVNQYNYTENKWQRSNNLNKNGMDGTNQYLSFTDKTEYGNENKFKNMLSCQMEAKNTTKQYPTDAVYVRTTSESYYAYAKKDNVGNEGSGNGDSYRDYKVYIANVEGQGVYIPGPHSKFENFPSNLTANSAENGVTIRGIDTTGNEVSAVVYKSGNKYKCVYGPNTYTYNSTYEYWKK